MRDGFAIIFSALRFDASTEELAYTENLAWLDTVKKTWGQGAEIESVLLWDTEEYSGGPIENFKPLSWSLASFFLNSGSEEYFRTLTEMFMVLSPDATAAENSRAAVKRLTLRTGFETVTADYRNYLASRKSFAELIEAGQKAYTAGDRVNAGLCFTEALSARPDQAVPYYYLGLIAYDDKNFAEAEEFYTAALERCADNGADSALIRYALGLNAVSSGRNADGIRWLEQAASAAPDRYGEKTRGLIERLR
jgi:tetratricopeptide (TPR) repeat protein